MREVAGESRRRTEVGGSASCTNPRSRLGNSKVLGGHQRTRRAGPRSPAANFPPSVGSLSVGLGSVRAAPMTMRLHAGVLIRSTAPRVLRAANIGAIDRHMGGGMMGCHRAIRAEPDSPGRKQTPGDGPTCDACRAGAEKY